jgi:hypothetical protein
MEEVIMYNEPSWYLTTSEFAALVVTAIEEAGFFKKNDTAHPEDIANAFATVAPSVALGISFAGNRAREKQGMMQTGNLRKGPVLPDDPEMGSLASLYAGSVNMNIEKH